MARSVVLAGAPRCPACALPPRYCTCAILEKVATAVTVHVLIHRLERHKPSSTGGLIARAVPSVATHTFVRVSRHLPPVGLPPHLVPADHELLILHPGGTPLPIPPTGCRPFALLLLDGTWRQAGEMLRSVEGRGRCVRLPDGTPTESRFWLREQRAPGCLSTAETLVVALDRLGDPAAARLLRLHFELHVLATLLARGRRDMARRFLGDSPLLATHPGILDHFDTPRPAGVEGTRSPSPVVRRRE